MSLGHRPPPPDICPVCGEDVPPRALACPECGADHNSGWREDGSEEDFDYDDFVEQEFGSGETQPRVHPIWVVTALVLFAAFLWWVIG